MLIDGHTHVYDRICGVTQYGVSKALGYGMIDLGINRPQRVLPPGFVDSICPCEILLKYLDWSGIDKAVLLTQNVYGYANSYLAECVNRYPDKFVALGSLDPMSKESNNNVEYLITEVGLKGIKLDMGSNLGLLALRPDFKLNDPYLMPIWKLIEKHNATLTIDLGGTFGTPGHQLDEIKSVLEAAPELKLVIAHLGFPPILDDGGTGHEKQWHELLDLTKSFRVWFDTAIFWFSTLLKDGNEQFPYPTLQKYFKKCYEQIGASKMIWGTDMPTILLWSTYNQNVEWIKSVTADLSREEKEAILWKNAAEVYDFKDIKPNIV